MASLATADSDVQSDELGDLLELHRHKIEQLKERLSDILVDNPETVSGTNYDDIWILRYVLSNASDPASDKGIKKAEDSMRKSITWRRQHAAALKAISEGQPVPFDSKFKEYNAVFRIYGNDGGPINIVCLSGSNPGALMDNASFKTVEEYLLMTKEEDYLICDRKTRESRKLVKMVSIIDMHDYGLFDGGGDRRFAKALGQTSNVSSDLYPQLLAKTIVVNTPTFISFVVRMMKLFMSERTFSKIAFLPVCGHGEPPSSGRIEDMIPNISSGALPDFFNGALDTSSIDLKKKKAHLDETSTVTIPARTCNECQLNVQEAGAMIAYLIAVKERNVIVSADLHNENGDPITLFEARKVESSEGTLIGTWKAPLAGRLIIKFDNGYSRFRSKTVRYCIKLVMEADKEADDGAPSDSDGV
jgi:hypothetical protein